MKMLLLAGLSLLAVGDTPAAVVARADAKLRQAFGGRYDGLQAALVAEVGRRVAAQSGLPGVGAGVTATLLNSPVENAFALPGGSVYATRQLLALMNSEAELASVMGHEVGHVAARHAAGQGRVATIGRFLALLVDAMTGADPVGTMVGRAGRVASTLYTLKYGHDQEYAADALGLRYAAAAGYPPAAAAAMLARLDAGEALRARIEGRSAARMPTWASTHPNGRERVRRAAGLAAALGTPAMPLAQDTGFLRRLGGLRYDDDPGDGVIDGQTFRQPRLRVRLTAPPGYALTRFGRVVHVAGPQSRAWFARTLPTRDPVTAVARRFRSLALRRPETIATGTSAGAPWATATASTRNVDVTVVAWRLATATVRLDIVTPRGTGAGALRPLIDSVAPLTEAEAAAVKGKVLRIDTVAAGDTIASIAERMAYPTLRRERFLTLNGLSPDAALVPGMLVKVVVAG